MTRIITSMFVFLLAFAASAQVVQPVYTRPSKSKVQDVLTQPENASATFTSPVYDVSTFYSAQLTFAPGDSSGGCGYYGTILFETSDKTTGPWIAVQDPSNDIQLQAANGAQTINVSNLSGYFRIKITSVTGGTCNGNAVYTLLLLPNPLSTYTQGALKDTQIPVLSQQSDFYPSIVGGVMNRLSSYFGTSLRLAEWNQQSFGFTSRPFLTVRPEPVSDIVLDQFAGRVLVGTAATIIPGSTRGTSLVIQNRSSIPINCGFSNAVTAPATDTNYAFTLPAETGGNKGSSAPYKIDGFNGDVWCIADSPNTPVAYYRP
jgi:hypothetical protein